MSTHMSLDVALDSFVGSLYLDPEQACGKCYDVSSVFAKLVGARLSNWTNPVGYDRLPDWADPADMSEDGEVAHVAVLIDDVVIDWTARQFWTTAPVPLVEPLGTYRARFERRDLDG